jgi:hypothetical protein
MIKFSQKLAAVWAKNANIFAYFFSKNIFKNHNISPRYVCKRPTSLAAGLIGRIVSSAIAADGDDGAGTNRQFGNIFRRKKLRQLNPAADFLYIFFPRTTYLTRKFSTSNCWGNGNFPQNCFLKNQWNSVENSAGKNCTKNRLWELNGCDFLWRGTDVTIF